MLDLLAKALDPRRAVLLCAASFRSGLSPQGSLPQAVKIPAQPSLLEECALAVHPRFCPGWAPGDEVVERAISRGDLEQIETKARMRWKFSGLSASGRAA